MKLTVLSIIAAYTAIVSAVPKDHLDHVKRDAVATNTIRGSGIQLVQVIEEISSTLTSFTTVVNVSTKTEIDTKFVFRPSPTSKDVSSDTGSQAVVTGVTGSEVPWPSAPWPSSVDNDITRSRGYRPSAPWPGISGPSDIDSGDTESSADTV